MRPFQRCYDNLVYNSSYMKSHNMFISSWNNCLALFLGPKKDIKVPTVSIIF